MSQLQGLSTQGLAGARALLFPFQSQGNSMAQQALGCVHQLMEMDTGGHPCSL